MRLLENVESVRGNETSPKMIITTIQTNTIRHPPDNEPNMRHKKQQF